MNTRPNAPILPAATVLLLRERAELEVFMVQRHDNLAFGPGAMVFPGGKVDPGDRDPALRALCGDVADVDDEQLIFRIAAVREAFEEAGVLLARDEVGNFPTLERLKKMAVHRRPLESDEITIGDFLQKEHLTLACDELVYFAHWVTPKGEPRRFDTHFFLAPAPAGHAGAHDGRESVDSIWTTPKDALAQAEAANCYLMPPTAVCLELLARSSTVQEALERARAEKVEAVEDGVDPRYPEISRFSQKYMRRFIQFMEAKAAKSGD